MKILTLPIIYMTSRKLGHLFGPNKQSSFTKSPLQRVIWKDHVKFSPSTCLSQDCVLHAVGGLYFCSPWLTMCFPLYLLSPSLVSPSVPLKPLLSTLFSSLCSHLSYLVYTCSKLMLQVFVFRNYSRCLWDVSVWNRRCSGKHFIFTGKLHQRFTANFGISHAYPLQAKWHRKTSCWRCPEQNVKACFIGAIISFRQNHWSERGLWLN